MNVLIDILFRLAWLMPSPLAVLKGRTWGWCLSVLRFRRRRLLENLATAFPEQSDAEREQLLRRIYRHFGLLLIEMLRLPCMTKRQLSDTVRIGGLDHVQAALSQGRGCLLLGGHLGNWEVCMGAMSSRGYKMAAVVKEIKSGPGNYAAERLRTSHGVKLIPRRNAIRQIVGALKEGTLVAFVLDQNMTSDEGIFVDFFGRSACTMAGLAVMAERYDVPVLPVCSFRDDDLRHHRLEFLPPLEWERPEGCSRDETIRHNTQRYTSVLEQLIRRHPEQWIWMHRRWRTQPEA